MTKKTIISNKKKQDMLKGLLGVAFSSSISDLPEVQIEVLYYLCVEFIKVPQIAKIRKTSPQAVRKVISKLRKKGLINSKNLPNKEIDIGGGFLFRQPLKRGKFISITWPSDDSPNPENFFKIYEINQKEISAHNQKQYYNALQA